MKMKYKVHRTANAVRVEVWGDGVGLRSMLFDDDFVISEASIVFLHEALYGTHEFDGFDLYAEAVFYA